jgi:phospholipid/cholesterol/gamma-HCH transport system substrate-binding protein
MKEQRRNILVGIFMVGGLAVMGLLMVMFGEAPEWLGGAEWPLEIHVTRLQGAPEGTPVNLNGVQIGRVGRLEFDDPARPDLGVSVVVLLKDKYAVPSGAYAVIYEPVLGVGRGRIEIIVPPEGAGPPLAHEKARIRGDMGSMIHDIVPETMLSSVELAVRQIGNFAEGLTPVANDLHEIFKKTPMELVDDPVQARRMTANLYTVIQRFDRTLKHFNDVLGDPNVKSGLLESVENVRRMTEDGRVALADFRETTAGLRESSVRITTKLEAGIDDTTLQVNRLSGKAMPVLDNLAAATANLNRASLSMAEGEGTLGKLLRDDRLYEKLVLFTDRITELVDTVRRIADKTERQGYVDVKAQTPVGPVFTKQKLYEPPQVADENKR